MTSPPVPSDPAAYNWTLGIAVVALMLVAGLFIYALLRVSTNEPPAMLTVTIGLLTLVALGLAAFTHSEMFATIAATGFGALAGALSSLFDKRALQHRIAKLEAKDPDADSDPPTQGG